MLRLFFVPCSPVFWGGVWRLREEKKQGDHLTEEPAGPRELPTRVSNSKSTAYRRLNPPFPTLSQADSRVLGSSVVGEPQVEDARF